MHTIYYIGLEVLNQTLTNYKCTNMKKIATNCEQALKYKISRSKVYYIEQKRLKQDFFYECRKFLQNAKQKKIKLNNYKIKYII